MLRGIFTAVFFCSFLVFGQTGNNNIELFYPEYVVAGKPFSVSILAGHRFDSTLTVTYTVFSEQKFSFREGFIRTSDSRSSVSVAPAYDNTSDFYTYTLSIAPHKYSNSSGMPYEIVLTFSTSFIGENRIFLKSDTGKKEEEPFGDSSPYDSDEVNTHNPGFITFYNPQLIAGTALTFPANANMQLGFNLDDENYRLITEYWIKFNKPGKFLTVQSRNFGTTELFIELNEFQFLSFGENILNLESYRNHCLSFNSWYHMRISYLPAVKNLVFEVNNDQVAVYRLGNVLNLRDLRFSFGSASGSKESSFEIDLLKVWRNKSLSNYQPGSGNYFSTSNDSSALLLQTGFDSQKDFAFDGEVFLRAQNTKLAVSNAPLFAIAPDLKLSVFAGAYMLEWESGAADLAKEYQLQKSIDGSPFKTIKTFAAAYDAEESYSYLDASTTEGKVVFYRIKQINTDESNTYSDQVKIGLGDQESFNVLGNFPNPFNPGTTIKIEIIEPSETVITVHNLQGKEVAVLFEGFLSKGIHEFQFDGEQLPSGIYLYTITTPVSSQTTKMILAK